MATTYYHTVDGEIQGQTTAGVRTDYLTDALGSVVATVNSSAQVVNTYRYKPYGERLARTGAGADPRFGWTGDTGSLRTGRSFSDQYNRARHYLLEGGQWSTIDGYWPRQAPYVYCAGDPTGSVDPLGLQRQSLLDAVDRIDRLERIEGPVQILPPRMFCPVHEGGLPPCMSTARGGCANQHPDGSFVDLRKFRSPGKPDRIDRCDPSQIDRDAIQRRIDELKDIATDLCSHDPNEAIPPGGGGYGVWVETIPCWRHSPGLGQYVSCNIHCFPSLGAPNRLGKYFDKGKARNGIGCINCCLLAHENHHCLQIILGGTTTRTYGVECEAFKHEIACLQRVLKGEPCS